MSNDYRVASLIEQAYETVFEKMYREQYTRDDGNLALLRVADADWADAWVNWWDEGDD